MDLTRRRLLQGSVASGGLLAAGCVSGTMTHVYPRLFPATTDEQADVDAGLATAHAGGRLALIILGADWCHDSAALIRMLKGDGLQAVIARDYNVTLINIGYFERGFATATRFGLAIYTHTPTVLVIDPAGVVVNAHDHHRWRDAAKISPADAIAYFQGLASGTGRAPRPPVLPSADAAALVTAEAAISAWEAGVATRLRTAYGLIGPRLAANASDLDAYWRPTRDIRYQFPDDLGRLRADALRQAVAGDRPIALDFPQYAPLPWES